MSSTEWDEKSKSEISKCAVRALDINIGDDYVDNSNDTRFNRRYKILPDLFISVKILGIVILISRLSSSTMSPRSSRS
jgi:hypothetical protein